MTGFGMINFKSRGVRIDDIDLPRIGHQIGVGEDEIHAFLEVEASNTGFDKQGRLKMLYEPHLMYRNAKGTQLQALVSLGLAYEKWKPGGYPADSYPRLEAAMKINEEAALKSCSWGLGQILGSNYAAAGYKSVYEMIESFCADEANQLQGAINFIKANKLDDDLRRHDWDGFARGYNGPNYRVHGYQNKLAAAFAKWQRIRDTPYDPAAPVPAVPVHKVPPTGQPVTQTTSKPVPGASKWNAFWSAVADLTKRG